MRVQFTTLNKLPNHCWGKFASLRMEIQGPLLEQSHYCEPILRALPDWFGIASALEAYILAIDSLPTFLAAEGEKIIGFLSLKQHNQYAAEIYVMGVYPEMHNHGAGRALLQTAEEYLRQQGCEYLQVKTLSPRHPDAGYAWTRAFYFRMGFRPIEKMTQVWGEENPCLLMIKVLQRAPGLTCFAGMAKKTEDDT